MRRSTEDGQAGDFLRELFPVLSSDLSFHTIPSFSGQTHTLLLLRHEASRLPSSFRLTFASILEQKTHEPLSIWERVCRWRMY